MAAIPKNIKELQERCRKEGVPEGDLEKFEEEIEEEDYDLEAIIEDVRHGIQESMLVESFKEKYEMGEDLYFLLKAILEGTPIPENIRIKQKENESKTADDEQEAMVTTQILSVGPNQENQDDDDDEEKKDPDNDEDEDENQPQLPNNTAQQPDTTEMVDIKEEKKAREVGNNQYIHSFIRRKLDTLTEEAKSFQDEQVADGTVILDPALLTIPYESISYAFCLENMKGILYILKYNHVHPSPAKGRLIGASFIEFWESFLKDEEGVTFKIMKEEIANNQGALYDNMMENPPNDRLLPVLEKLVDQLAHPKLTKGLREEESKSNESSSKSPSKLDTIQREEAKKFFHSMPRIYPNKEDEEKPTFTNLLTTCQLFQKNVDENNNDRYELMVTVFDIYCRLLPNHLPQRHDPVAIFQHFFESYNRLDTKYWNAMRATFREFGTDTGFSKGLLQNLFTPMIVAEAIPDGPDAIPDSAAAFQSISCSFLLFVKAFLCDSGNRLELHGHQKRTKKGKKNRPKEPVMESLADRKKENAKNKSKSGGAQDVLVDEDDVEFWNLNFPLQFDLVVIAKGATKSKYADHGLDKYEHEDITVVSANVKGLDGDQYGLKNDKQRLKDEVYRLYGEMVRLFRRMLFEEGTKNKKKETGNESDNREDVEERRDDRYVIVVDRIKGKMYMFPPHLANGDPNETSDDGSHRWWIVHRKRTQQKAKKDDDESKEDNGQEKVPNKFSFVPHEYNDFTNFYLTQQCVFPAKPDDPNEEMKDQPKKEMKDEEYNAAHLGVGGGRARSDRTDFMLSAHFHRQKEWHRHPKLRVYQYFRGSGMRFFHSSQDNSSVDFMTGYAAQRDICDLWPLWFQNRKNALNAQDIVNLQVFDAVMDLYKCDPNFVRWDCAVRRQWIQGLQRERNKGPFVMERYKAYIFQAWHNGNGRGYLDNNGRVVDKKVKDKSTTWEVMKHDRVHRSKEDPSIEEEIVYTLKCGKKYLGIKENEKGGPTLIIKDKGLAKKSKDPLRQFAWKFETFYDDIHGRDNAVLKNALSIKSALNDRYLIDLIDLQTKPPYRITHWVMVGTEPIK